MNKLANLIQQMNYEDIQLIKKDLDHGNISKLIEKRLKEAKGERLSICPVCNAAVQEGAGLYLEFGSSSLRKKASFDTPHCLEYFAKHHLTKLE